MGGGEDGRHEVEHWLAADATCGLPLPTPKLLAAHAPVVIPGTSVDHEATRAPHRHNCMHASSCHAPRKGRRQLSKRKKKKKRKGSRQTEMSERKERKRGG